MPSTRQNFEAEHKQWKTTAMSRHIKAIKYIQDAPSQAEFKKLCTDIYPLVDSSVYSFTTFHNVSATSTKTSL